MEICHLNVIEHMYSKFHLDDLKPVGEVYDTQHFTIRPLI